VQIDPDALPDDSVLLRQMLRTVLHQHGELQAENDKLRLLIERLTRHQFGRRSEQLTAEQLQFGLEDLVQTAAEDQVESAEDRAGPPIAEMQQPSSRSCGYIPREAAYPLGHECSAMSYRDP
jgi:hypothetical protein